MEERKTILLAFQGEMMCFVHVLLTALDLFEKNMHVRVIIEGSATGLIPKLASGDSPFSGLYKKMIDHSLLECVCKACSQKTGVLKDVQQLGLPLASEMDGHPSIARFIEDGYEIISY